MQPTPRTADVVVVGSGIMGASIAYQLASKSDAKIVVVDERPPVGGMSGRTFGQIRQHYSNELLVQMAKHGFNTIQNWESEVAYGSPGYVKLGYLLLVTENQLDALQRNINLGQRCGVDTQFVDATEIAALEPLLVTKDLSGGAYEPDGGYIDVTKMVLSWLSAAQANGVQVINSLKVKHLRSSNNCVTGVTTDFGDIDAPLVVLATGAWANDLLEPIGAAVPLQKRRLELTTLQTQAGQAQIRSCITDGNSNIVLRPDMGCRFVAAAYPAEMPLVDNPLAMASQADQTAHLTRIEAALAQRIPSLQAAIPAHHVSGAYDVTPDYHPIIGWAPELAGLCLAVGFSGHGLKLSPAIGEMVAAIVLGHEPPFDPQPLRPSRFAERDLMYCAYGPSARA